MGTEGHLPGEMQPPLIPNSLSRRGWAVAAWGFQLSPPPLPTGFAAATLTHVSFPAPHFLLLKEITHHLPPGNRFKSPFEETAYLPQGCSSAGGGGPPAGGWPVPPSPHPYPMGRKHSPVETGCCAWGLRGRNHTWARAGSEVFARGMNE